MSNTFNSFGDLAWDPNDFSDLDGQPDDSWLADTDDNHNTGPDGNDTGASNFPVNSDPSSGQRQQLQQLQLTQNNVAPPPARTADDVSWEDFLNDPSFGENDVSNEQHNRTQTAEREDAAEIGGPLAEEAQQQVLAAPQVLTPLHLQQQVINVCSAADHNKRQADDTTDEGRAAKRCQSGTQRLLNNADGQNRRQAPVEDADADKVLDLHAPRPGSGTYGAQDRGLAWLGSLNSQPSLGVALSSIPAVAGEWQQQSQLAHNELESNSWQQNPAGQTSAEQLWEDLAGVINPVSRPEGGLGGDVEMDGNLGMYGLQHLQEYNQQYHHQQSQYQTDYHAPIPSVNEAFSPFPPSSALAHHQEIPPPALHPQAYTSSSPPQPGPSRLRASTAPFYPRPSSSTPTTTSTSGICLDCHKPYRLSLSPGRCKRCGLKYERRTAQPPYFVLDPNVPSLEKARDVLFPIIEGREIVLGDSDKGEVVEVWEVVLGEFWGSREFEGEWRVEAERRAVEWGVGEFLKGVNEACQPPAVDAPPSSKVGGDEQDQEQDPSTTPWALNQQRTFNEKAKMLGDSLYSPAHVTARLRALMSEVINFHSSTSSLGRVFYPIGGDTQGYGEDLTMGFRERVDVMREVLRRDKRVVMDVLEGRGVRGFVGSPWSYHKRKDSNNGCNEKKKTMAQVAREEIERREAEEGGGGGVEEGSRRNTRAKGKARGSAGRGKASLLSAVQNVEKGDDGDGDGEFEPGPSSSRRPTRRRRGLRSDGRGDVDEDDDDLGGVGHYFQ